MIMMLPKIIDHRFAIQKIISLIPIPANIIINGNINARCPEKSPDNLKNKCGKVPINTNMLNKKKYIFLFANKNNIPRAILMESIM